IASCTFCNAADLASFKTLARCSSRALSFSRTLKGSPLKHAELLLAPLSIWNITIYLQNGIDRNQRSRQLVKLATRRFVANSVRAAAWLSWLEAYRATTPAYPKTTREGAGLPDRRRGTAALSAKRSPA